MSAPQITILQNLGDGKAIVLISGWVDIPTSAAAGTYSCLQKFNLDLILLAASVMSSGGWFYENIADTLMSVTLDINDYSFHDRFLQVIDGVRIDIRQNDSTARTVQRAYLVVGVASV